MRRELVNALALIAALLMSVATYARLRSGALGFGLLDRDTVLGHLIYFAWLVAITLPVSRGIGAKEGLGWPLRSSAVSVAGVLGVFALLALRAGALADFEEFARFELAPSSLLCASAIAVLIYFLTRGADSELGGSASFMWIAIALAAAAGALYGILRLLSIGEHVRQFVAVAAGLHLPALFLFAARARGGEPKPEALTLGAVLLFAAAWL